MSRRRQQRRAEKAHRHRQPPWPTERPWWPTEPRSPTQPSAVTNPPRVVVRETSYVERLAYTRTQAAQALGISRSTLRRVLPYVDTIEMPWGGKLIPVDELERLVAERRRAAMSRRPTRPRGRRPSVPPDIVERIRLEYARGRGLAEIARGLTAEGIPTAHGGQKWWPSTVRAVLVRSTPLKNA